MSTHTQLLHQLELIENVLVHLLSDLSRFDSDTIIYNVDYNLLYPYLWRNHPSNDQMYDIIGRNLFSLHSRYSDSAGFKLVLTLPSLLELLDTLSHNVDAMNRLADDKGRSDAIFAAVDELRRGRIGFDREQSVQLREFLVSQRLAQLGQPFSHFLDALRNRKITLVRDHNVDIEKFSSRNPSFRARFDDVFEKMNRQRGPADNRDIDDREFHYRVDAWNIALSLMNSDTRESTEVDYVCRPSLRTYYSRSQGQLYSRHPFVPVYWLFSLARSAGADTTREAHSFTEDAVRQIHSIANVVRTAPRFDLSLLSDYNRDLVDLTYDKFVRPLFKQYSDNSGGLDVTAVERERDEMNEKAYASITTAQGFRDRFKQDASDMQSAAKTLAEIRPELLSDRLDEEYSLNKNPRIEAVRRKLGLG